MTYLSTNIAGAKLTINGTDYSNELVSFNVSDDSIRSSSLVATTGDITLAQTPSGLAVNDLFGDVFKRGQIITLDIKQPNGEYIRHPRGYLFIISSAYDLESKTLTLQVGCAISFALEYEAELSTVGDTWITIFANQDLVQDLDPEQERNLDLLGNLLVAKGEAIYQDRWGYVQKINIFGSTGLYTSSVNAPYKFTAYDTISCFSVENNSDSKPPGSVSVGFTFDQLGYNGEEPDTSSYEDDILKDLDQKEIDQENFNPYKTDNEFIANSSCSLNNRNSGNAQSDLPETSVTYRSAQDPAYQYVQLRPGIAIVDEYFTYAETSKTIKEYNGPGGQVSRETVYTTTDARAILSSYYSALLQFYYANKNFGGLALAITNYRSVSVTTSVDTYTYYGPGGEVSKKITDNYVPSATFETTESYAARGPLLDYGFGARLGQSTKVDYQYNVPAGGSSLYQSAGKSYQRGKTWNIETTVVTDYVAEAQTKQRSTTFTRRKSGGNIINPFQQPNKPASEPPPDPSTDLCSPKNQTTESVEYRSEQGAEPRFSVTKIQSSDTDNAFGQLNIDVITDTEFVNYPLQLSPAISIETANRYITYVDEYAIILYNKAYADRSGFTLQEALRPELYSWYPGYPYRFVLASEGRAFYLRGSSGTWTVTKNEAVCSLEGMNISEYKTFTIAPPFNNTQTDYLIPPIVAATTGNNQTSNHDATLGNSVRRVTVTSGSPSIASVAISSLPSISPSTLIPTVRVTQTLNFRVPVRLAVAPLTVTPIGPSPAAVDLNHQTNVTLSISEFYRDQGTISGPAPGSLDFGLIAVDTNALDCGTIATPLV